MLSSSAAKANSFLPFIAFSTVNINSSSPSFISLLTVTIFFQGLEIYGQIEVDSVVGMVKGIFFGFSITSIACYKGFYAEGGASGVGKSTTETVVVSCIAIVILDYVLAAILL